MDILRFIRTVRYMSARQILAQIRHRAKRALGDRMNLKDVAVPQSISFSSIDETEFPVPPAQANSPREILEGRFTFLNNKQALGWPPDWSGKDLSTLWRYNLHYFDWLWILEPADARQVVQDWMQIQNEAMDPVAWEPYPTSLRLMNWLAFFLGAYREETLVHSGFRAELERMVFMHAQWLKEHLETHLRGNHLLENAAALITAGSFFSGGKADEWFTIGLAILRPELEEQILDDGTHFERSPMYHCRVLYLLNFLKALDRSELRELLAANLPKMRTALAHLSHPDGRIALLNDSAFGIYSPGMDVGKPSEGPWALPEAGYYGYRGRDGFYIVCDAGQIGPAYLPGHAHGDIFSFEMSVTGQRAIVDSGVHDYENSDLRQYCRSTRAHNTVEIEGQDQCEFWGAFRVARRGYPRDVCWEPDERGFRLSGWHDGTMRLPGKPKHFRTFQLEHPDTLQVIDRVVSTKPVHCASRLHVHPDCTVSILSERTARIDYGPGMILVEFSGEGRLELEESLYCPEFGKKLTNQCLVYHFSGTDTETGFRMNLQMNHELRITN